VDRIFQGLGTVSDTVLPPTVEGHLATKVYSYDPDRARQLIREAAAEAKLRDQTYSILTIGLGDLQDIAAVAQDNWRAIGVNVRIESAETAVLLQRARAGNYDIMAFAQLRTEPEQFLVTFFHSSNIGSTNYSRYAQIDKALDTFRLATNPRIRARLIEEAQRQLQEDAPHIPVLNPTLVLVTNQRIRGAQLGLLIFNVWQWSQAR
jgi:ABC-type transport system substrate-binding protein